MNPDDHKNEENKAEALGAGLVLGFFLVGAILSTLGLVFLLLKLFPTPP